MNEFRHHPQYDLIQKIYHGQLAGQTEVSAKATLEALARLGFEGFLKGDYFAWGCGSWLGSSITGAVEQCEEFCGVAFSEVVEALWSSMDLVSKKNLIESYLLLPVPSYKTADSLDDDFRFSDFQEIWEELNRKWRDKGRPGPIHIDQTLLFQERFQMYLASKHFPEAIRPYLGSRISPQEETTLFRELAMLNPDLRSKIRNAFAQSSMPFWRRLAKRIS